MILLAYIVWLLDLAVRAALIAGLLGLLWLLVLMLGPVLTDRGGESRG